MASNIQTSTVQPGQRNDLIKIIALLTMLIDHIGYLFFPETMIFRTIGRIAFPIFAYQIATGFKKTTNRKKYAARLLGFAMISQLPYFWFNTSLVFSTNRLNIMFTFFIALGMLHTFESSWLSFRKFVKTSNIRWLMKSIVCGIVFSLILIVPELIALKYNFSIEYGSIGLLVVLLFYLTGSHALPMVFGYTVLSAIGAYYTAAKWYHYSTEVSFWQSLLEYRGLWEKYVYYQDSFVQMTGVFFQSRSLLALPIILFGEWFVSKGAFKIQLNKYVGYWFYPVHMSILMLIHYSLQ